MAEIRINATGGVKLYDADDSHYAQIVAGTITSNVDAITLGHDTVTIADNLSLGSDSAVLKFGADGDTTLTHTDGTGLTLNSTNKLCFNDASQYIQGASNAILDIAATDEIELNATLVDINANVEISGTATTTGVHTFSATPVFPDGSLALADLDIDGGTDIGAAIVDADLFIVDDGAGGTNRKTTASRLKTYIGGGITEADIFRLTTPFQGDANPVASNWERADTGGFGKPGTGLSQSSGVFTFPSTGYWYLTARSVGYLADGDGSEGLYSIYIYTSVDNGSSWVNSSFSGQAMTAISGETIYASVICHHLFDVTNTTNDQVRIRITAEGNSDTYTGGDSDVNRLSLMALRLADT